MPSAHATPIVIDGRAYKSIRAAAPSCSMSPQQLARLVKARGVILTLEDVSVDRREEHPLTNKEEENLNDSVLLAQTTGLALGQGWILQKGVLFRREA